MKLGRHLLLSPVPRACSRNRLAFTTGGPLESLGLDSALAFGVTMISMVFMLHLHDLDGQLDRSIGQGVSVTGGPFFRASILVFSTA